MKLRKAHITWIVPAVAGAILFFSCKKHHDNVSSPTTTETPFWDAVVGHYKVYDTTGDFIYEMDISHIVEDSNDLTKFENFDGEFTFTAIRSYNYPYYVNLGVHDTLYDLNHKRWRLAGVTDTYYNNMHGDTLPLYFQKTNINFWIYDAVSYYSAFIKQTAVKQH